MSRIPNCREDECYNERYLDEAEKDIIKGYDWAVERIDNMMDNLEVYQEDMEIDGEDINLVRLLKNHEDVSQCFRDCIKHWMEMERNTIITSFIDNMTDKEYEEAKHRADPPGKE